MSAGDIRTKNAGNFLTNCVLLTLQKKANEARNDRNNLFRKVFGAAWSLLWGFIYGLRNHFGKVYRLSYATNLAREPRFDRLPSFEAFIAPRSSRRWDALSSRSLAPGDLTVFERSRSSLARLKSFNALTYGIGFLARQWHDSYKMSQAARSLVTYFAQYQATLSRTRGGTILVIPYRS